MPVADGGSSGGRGGRGGGGGGGGGGGPVVHHPDSPPQYNPGGTATGPTTNGTGSGSGGGGGGYNYAAEARKARRRAAQRNLDSARQLQGTIDSLQYQLSKKGFRAALNQQLANIRVEVRQNDQMLVDQYTSRVGDLTGQAAGNEKAMSGQAYANLSNRGRERANAISEAMAHGAGESDLLRAQGMSLRNWNANEQEVQRSYFDTLESINSSLGDLTANTQTSRYNAAAQGNADRNSVWSLYYDQQQEAFTSLGNAYGSRAEYIGMAREQTPSKKLKKRQKRVAAQGREAQLQAGKWTGRSYKNPGVRAAIRNWEGEEDFEATETGELGQLNAAGGMAANRPEGATLRKW